MTTKTPKKQTKTELTYKKIRNQILKGDLKSGQRISANSLASQYGVTRSAVHESLARLQAEGLVRNNGPYSRTYVEEPDLPKVIEYYEVREYVEGLAARLAARSMNAMQVEQLRRIAERAIDADQTDDQSRFGEMNLAFHHYLVANCGNELLLKIYEMHHLIPVWIHLRQSSESVLGMAPGESMSEHFGRICDAIAIRDGDAAEEAVRQTIRVPIQQLRAMVMEKDRDLEKASRDHKREMFENIA